MNLCITERVNADLLTEYTDTTDSLNETGASLCITKRFTESTLIHSLSERGANCGHYRKIHWVNTDSFTEWREANLCQCRKIHWVNTESLTEYTDTTDSLNERKMNLSHEQKESLIQTMIHWLREERISVITERFAESTLIHSLNERGTNFTITEDSLWVNSLICWTREKFISIMTKRIHSLKHWFTEQERSESWLWLKRFTYSVIQWPSADQKKVMTKTFKESTSNHWMRHDRSESRSWQKDSLNQILIHERQYDSCSSHAQFQIRAHEYEYFDNHEVGYRYAWKRTASSSTFQFCGSCGYGFMLGTLALWDSNATHSSHSINSNQDILPLVFTGCKTFTESQFTVR